MDVKHMELGAMLLSWVENGHVPFCWPGHRVRHPDLQGTGLGGPQVCETPLSTSNTGSAGDPESFDF